MALIMNATAVEQRVKVFGNYFSLPPDKIKNFQENIAHFLTNDRAYLGFVSIPEKFDELDYRDSEEGKAELVKIKMLGVQRRILYLKQLINNETVSLQKDLDIKGIKIDPRVYMDDKMVVQMKELSDYQTSAKDAAQDKLKLIKRLEKKL